MLQLKVYFGPKIIIIIIIIIINSCYPLGDIGHQQNTAILSYFWPSSNASLWTVLHHICLGLPLFLFPYRFQSKASLSMASCPFLSVCPIQFHFHLMICMDILISLVLPSWWTSRNLHWLHLINISAPIKWPQREKLEKFTHGGGKGG